MMAELLDTDVAQRQGIIDLFVSSDPGADYLILITVRHTKQKTTELEIFHFTDQLTSPKLSITLTAFDTIVKMLDDAGHQGLLRNEHPVQAYGTLEKIKISQTLDKFGNDLEPTFVRILQHKDELKISDIHDMDNDFYQKIINYLVACSGQKNTGIFTAGSVENYRDKLQMKIDMKTPWNIVRIE